MISNTTFVERPAVVVVMASERHEQIGDIVQTLGYQVKRARGVHEGAQLVAANAGTVAVLIEVALRDGNWLDLVEKVRLRNPHVPLVLCAESWSAELWWDASDCGVSEVISPPYASAEFERFLQSMA